jgi:hypothetical protein
MTVHIIGNGLFGRIASDMLSREGIENVVYDADLPKSGSSASGNITKPSWVTGLGDAAKQAYRDLDDMYGLRKFEPTVGLGKKIELYYVHRDNIIGLPHVKAEVQWLEDGRMGYDDKIAEGPILVAAGVWCNQLVEMPHIEPVTGVSFIFRKPDDYHPQFNVWAPYKQAISYNYDKYVWFGDGQAIKDKNWKEERVATALERARGHGLEDRPLEVNTGYRPYVWKHKNGYFAQVANKVWVSTGGGKNGIVLAAVQARQFLEELKASGHR